MLVWSLDKDKDQTESSAVVHGSLPLGTLGGTGGTAVPTILKQQTCKSQHEDMLRHRAHLQLHSQWPHHATSAEVCSRALTRGTGEISGSTKISGSTSAHLSQGHTPRVAQSAGCVGCTLAFPVFLLPLPAAKQQLEDFLYLYARLGLETGGITAVPAAGVNGHNVLPLCPHPKEQWCMSDMKEEMLPNHGEPVCAITCSVQTHSSALQSF